MNQSRELQPGQRVGNYMLHEPVGRGAFAEVWRATHHERPRRIVAIKIATNPQYARQLRREARRPELNHPHIVPILDCDTLDDPPYVVMPYYSGGSLAELIRAHPTGLPEDRVQQILTDILEGLSAAHAAGLLHCDIKPHNILLTKEGRAVLADFGLAYCPPAGAGASVCQSASLERERQTLAGTLGYLAPELLDGAPPSPRSDVYGLAITLFEMLTGRRPIGPELPSQVRHDLRQPVFWDGLYWWASCAPEQRYADAGQMRAALRAGPRPAPLGPQPDASPARHRARAQPAVQPAAVRWYRFAAWLGDADAQFNLGWCYDNGDGVTKDPAEAVRWYRMAAEQGHADAQYSLGLCYDIGWGVPEDPAEAVRWFRMAAEQGHAAAQFNLGWCYDNGDGVTKDPAEAVRWYRKAAEQGLAAAKHALETLESFES